MGQFLSGMLGSGEQVSQGPPYTHSYTLTTGA